MDMNKIYKITICLALLIIFSGCFAKETHRVTMPTISLYGDKEVILEVGETYVEYGAAATDKNGSKLLVTTSGNIDNLTEGEYFIIYSAEDLEGNSVQIKRKITVIKKSALIVTKGSREGPVPFINVYKYTFDMEIYNKEAEEIKIVSSNMRFTNEGLPISLKINGKTNILFSVYVDAGITQTSVEFELLKVTGEIIKKYSIKISE